MSEKPKGFEKKKARGAPAYMGQFAALMTILLAFFIIMLTFGQDRVAQFKVGVGEIQNVIGLTGGSGVMSFLKTVRRPPVPRVMKEEPDHPDAALIGHEEQTGESDSLSDHGIESIALLSLQNKVLLRSPLQFAPGSIRVGQEEQPALEHAATLLYALPEHRIVVSVQGRMRPDDVEAARRLAARRAAWLTRYLTEQGRIPMNRIRSQGRISEDVNAVPGEEMEVVFWLRRMTAAERNL